MSVEPLTTDIIVGRLRALDGTASEQSSSECRPVSGRYIRPLADTAQSLLDALQIRDGIGLGIADLDVLTRGFRPTDLVTITGFAHSGKTQVVNTMILNNPERKILFFSLDDPAEMILAKLVAMATGQSAATLEERVRQGDPTAAETINKVADEQLSNLAVVDDVIGMKAMQDAVAEAAALWGQPPDAVIIDYLEMMPGDAMSDDAIANVKAKATDLKRWAKTADYPLIVLHQGSRSNSRPGEPITLLSMGYSGEQQSTIVIGVRRKRDLPSLEAWERQHHDKTVTLHVVKNKRPGGRLTHYDGIDLHMDPTTGLIRAHEPSEALTLGQPHTPAARAYQQAQFAPAEQTPWGEVR